MLGSLLNPGSTEAMRVSKVGSNVISFSARNFFIPSMTFSNCRFSFFKPSLIAWVYWRLCETLCMSSVHSSVFFFRLAISVVARLKVYSRSTLLSSWYCSGSIRVGLRVSLFIYTGLCSKLTDSVERL